MDMDVYVAYSMRTYIMADLHVLSTIKGNELNQRHKIDYVHV